MSTGYTLTVGGIDVTPQVDRETAEAELTAGGRAGLFHFTLRDESPFDGSARLLIAERAEVVLEEPGAGWLFSGELAHVSASLDGAAIVYACAAQSFECLLDQRVIEAGARSGARSDWDDVAWIGSLAADLGLAADAWVDTLAPSIPDLDYSGRTLRGALELLAATLGGPTFWVDAGKELHWTDPARVQRVAEPDFTGGGPWVLDGAAARTPDAGPGGPGDAALVTTGSGAGRHETTQLIVGIVTGRRYLVAADLWNSVAGAATLRIEWQRNTGAVLRTDTLGGDVPAGTWTRRKAVLVAPMLAVKVLIRCGGGDGFTGSVRHDHLVLAGQDAAFGISTSPDGVATVAPSAWERPSDAASPVNRLLVRGSGISGWREHPASIRAYGGRRFEAVLDDERVTTGAGIDGRARWVFDRYALPVAAGRYRTTRPGLAPGTWQIVEIGPLGLLSLERLASVRLTFAGAGTIVSEVTYGAPEDELAAAVGALGGSGEGRLNAAPEVAPSVAVVGADASSQALALAAGTWTRFANTHAAFIPAYVGQRWLLLAAVTLSPSANVTLQAGVRIDADTAGTAIATLGFAAARVSSGLKGAFSPSGIWTADRAGPVHAYLVVQSSGAATVTTTGGAPSGCTIVAVPLAG